MGCALVENLHEFSLKRLTGSFYLKGGFHLGGDFLWNWILYLDDFFLSWGGLLLDGFLLEGILCLEGQLLSGGSFLLNHDDFCTLLNFHCMFLLY